MADDQLTEYLIFLYENKYPIGKKWENHLNKAGYFKRKEAPAFAIVKAKQENPVLSIASQDLDAHAIIHETLTKEMLTYTPQPVKENNRPWLITYDTIDQEFWEWIISINAGFQRRLPYKRLQRYVDQTDEWLRYDKRIEDRLTTREREDYLISEVDKFDVNKLYWLQKYWRFKNARSRTGFSPSRRTPAITIVCFLYDCGFDLDIAKARQVYMTSTMYGIAAIELLIHFSFFIKWITADEKKVLETFDQKFRSPYYDLPSYIKPAKTYSDTQKTFVLHKKKGQEGGGSEMSVVPPSIDAVNSGSPDVIFGDEQGLMSIVAEMKNEAKAPSLQYDPATGKYYKKTKSIWWGTSDMIQFPDFELSFKNQLQRFQDKQFNLEPIPLFLNVYARENFTKELYAELRTQAYSDNTHKREHTIIQFHQSFCDDLEDMFMSNPKTLIPLELIDRCLKDIDSKPADVKYGFYIPKYNMSDVNLKSSDQPAHIVGSEFVETTSLLDPRTTTIQFKPPPENEVWENRFYHGVDPINNVSGTSNFSSTVLDIVEMKPMSLVCFRPTDPVYAFNQGLLQALHYGTFTPSLHETNMGAGYKQYLLDNGYEFNLVPYAALPYIFQIGTTEPYGINKRAGNNSIQILNAMAEYFMRNYAQVKIRTYFTELKTFVNKSMNPMQPKFEPKKEGVHFSDALYSMCYAYICYLCFDNLLPRNLSEKKKNATKIFKRVMTSDYTIVMEEVMEDA